MTAPVRCVVVTVAWTIAIGAVGIHVIEPPSRRINIRWSETISPGEIAQLEHMFKLTAGELLDGRTWGYTLLDESRENVGLIVTHPSVEDTHFINRSRLTIVQDLAVVPRWMRSLRQTMVVRFGRTIWLWAGLAFGFVGLAAAWSFRRNPMFLILGASSGPPDACFLRGAALLAGRGAF